MNNKCNHIVDRNFVLMYSTSGSRLLILDFISTGKMIDVKQGINIIELVICKSMKDVISNCVQ